MLLKTRLCRWLCVLGCLVTTGIVPRLAYGQPAAAPAVPNGQTVVTLQQKVEPSFRIEPVVQRFQASRGQVIPFEFVMVSTGREMEVELKVVELRQEENGTILHKEDGKPAAGVTFQSPTTFTLNAGDSRKITGEVTVPAAKSNFHSFGILVRDKGQIPTFQQPEKQAAVQAGVHFVTQYILRCDIEVIGSNENDMSKVRLEQGGFRMQDGLPVARVVVDNPTDSAFEFHVRGMVQTADANRKGEQLKMGMASRANLEEPEKHLVRIMPHSRLRLEAPVTNLLTPGNVQVNFAVHNGRREIVTESFQTEILAGDFPALDVAAVRVSEQVTVSPGQISLSQIKGGTRTVSLKVVNSSEQPQEVQFQLRDLNGQELPAVQVSPAKTNVGGKRTQNVRVTLRTQKDPAANQFGYLHVTSRQNETELTNARIPVAIQFASMQAPEVEFAPLEMITLQGQTAFRVVAENRSAGFAPIRGDLVLFNEYGQRMQMSAGFNKWIPPQESFNLDFRPEVPLSAGKYQATLSLRTVENLPPKVLTTEFELQPVEEKK